MQAGDSWSEEGAIATVIAAAKMRRDSIAQFEQGGRIDLAAHEKEELAVVERYMPVQLTENEIDEFVVAAIVEAGATRPEDMGKVMSALMPKTRGRADGKLLSALVRKRLSAS